MHYIENKSSVSSLEMWLEVKEYPKLCNVLNYLLLLASIIVVSYFFFISAASTLYFFFPTCIPQIFFSFLKILIALGKTHNTLLNRSAKIRHSCLILQLRILTIKCDVSFRKVIDDLYQAEKVPFRPR